MARRQLLALGLTARAIERRLEAGRLRPVHRRVYVLGPIVPARARAMAAVLACGPRAALSHRSAAALWGLLPRTADPRPVEVSVAGRNPGRIPGIRVRRTTSLRRDEVTARDRITVTTPERTLLDLAAGMHGLELERAIAEAFALRLTSRAGLLATLERHRGRPGTRELRRQLAAERAPARTRSPGEARLLAAIRDTDLPEPQVNVRVGRWEVDLLWPERALAVEVDGYAAHSSPWAFERDHAKTAALQDAGYLVLRVTWRQLCDEPERVLARIARALGR